MAASLEMAEANAVEAANKAVVVVAAQTAKESAVVETGAAAISAVVEVEETEAVNLEAVEELVVIRAMEVVEVAGGVLFVHNPHNPCRKHRQIRLIQARRPGKSRCHYNIGMCFDRSHQ